MKSNVELYVGMKNQSAELLKFIMPLHKILAEAQPAKV
ncbi:hypothetical protein GGQ68_000727 [Sagittula marina]|uniref:Uncharacterized protein n=1 Tax=Sagittula marina TaxID=943940 RepID=A0A7W6DJI9_9RHOB|nr:hypothetical protein [Sagittula marina]